MQSEGKRLTFQNDVADRDIVNSPDRLNAELSELTRYLENIQKEISAERLVHKYFIFVIFTALFAQLAQVLKILFY